MADRNSARSPSHKMWWGFAAETAPPLTRVLTMERSYSEQEKREAERSAFLAGRGCVVGPDCGRCQEDAAERYPDVSREDSEGVKLHISDGSSV